jgi:hypothetical protein
MSSAFDCGGFLLALVCALLGLGAALPFVVGAFDAGIFLICTFGGATSGINARGS